jgi:hypothetical protein
VSRLMQEERIGIYTRSRSPARWVSIVYSRSSPTHLVRIVHTSRQLGVKESHKLLETDAGVTRTSLSQFGFGFLVVPISRSDMIIQVVICRGYGGVPVRVIKSSFLSSWSAPSNWKTAERESLHLGRSGSDKDIISIPLPMPGLVPYFVGLLKIGEEFGSILDIIWILVRMIQ